MSERERYRLGPDIPDDEELTDSQGRVVDDVYVEGAVEQALDTVRRRGRPSLSDEGESPLLRVRLSRELDDAIRRAAEQAGSTRSEWVRQVLDEAVHRAS
jgi:predicted HicB family RNase H-like nuclease